MKHILLSTLIAAMFATTAQAHLYPYSKDRHVPLHCSGQVSFWAKDNPNIEDAIPYDWKDCTIVDDSIVFLDSQDGLPTSLIKFIVGKIPIDTDKPLFAQKQTLIDDDTGKTLGQVSASFRFIVDSNNFNMR